MNKNRFFTCIFILPIILLITTGCVSTTDPTRQGEKEDDIPYESISHYIVIGDPDSALNEYDKAVSEKKSEVVQKILYARLLLLAGKIVEAKTELASVLEMEPQNIDALITLAMVWGAEGNRKKQKEILEQILAIDAAYVSALSSLGEIYLEENNTKSAEEYFNQALKSDPKALVPLLGLGNIMLRKKKYKEAIGFYDQAIAADPDYGFTYTDRAFAKERSKDFAGAIEDLSLAISLEPDYYWNYIDRGDLYTKTGKIEAAIADYNEAIKIDPGHFIAYAYLGAIYYNRKNPDKAKYCFEKVYALKKDYFYIYEPLGVIYYQEEKWGDAFAMFSNAFASNKNEFSYVLLAAICRKKEKKDEEAKRYLEKNMKAMPQDSWYYEAARFFINPQNDIGIQTKYTNEKNRVKKKQLLFYMAVQYALMQRIDTARSYFVEVITIERKDVLEYDLARWELKQIGGTIDEDI